MKSEALRKLYKIIDQNWFRDTEKMEELHATLRREFDKVLNGNEAMADSLMMVVYEYIEACKE